MKMKLKRMESCGGKKTRKQRKTGGSRGVAEEAIRVVEMDEQIWKEFPEDLQENVIARLPMTTIMASRLVCRKWNLLMKIPDFVPQQNKHLLYAVKYGYIGGALYDPLVKKWYFTTTYRPLHYEPIPTLASDGGLVCYASKRSSSFWVGNPLTQTWKEFPWSANHKAGLANFCFGLALVVNPGERGYKIVWVHQSGNYGVCDSLTNTTTTGTVSPDLLKWRPLVVRRGVTIGNVVYWQGWNPKGITSYDLGNGTWDEFLIPDPPRSNFTSLAKCGERLLLVGLGDYEPNSELPQSITPVQVCVWELEKASQSWIEVDRMPSSYCSEFRYEPVIFVCMGNKGMLMMQIKASKWKGRYTGANRVIGIFTYDVVSREWAKAPDCIPPGYTKSEAITAGIDFCPSLTASP